MNDEPTGPCPLNCRRTARPVGPFLLNLFVLINFWLFIEPVCTCTVCMLGLSAVHFWLGYGDL